MINDLDLISAFDGLQPNEARDLTNEIRDAVQKILTAAQARRIRDASIRRIMEEENCIYPSARAKLNAQKRTMRRAILQRVAETGWTREAAFLSLQDELNKQKEMTDEHARATTEGR
jgi:hypothetical protein